MVPHLKFYIDGAWVVPSQAKTRTVINPANEQALHDIALGNADDVNKAVAAARRAFESFSQTTREERIALLTRIIEVYKTRAKDLGAAVSDEMGAPLAFAEKMQVGAGLGHIVATLGVLKDYDFEETIGNAEVVRVLIAAGAPLDHVNNLGWTALLEAVILGDGGAAHTEIVRLLAEAGAKVDLADRDGVTPLAHARRRGFARITSILERAGARSR